MLDFTFTEEQEMFRTMVRDFVKNEVAPGYKERKRLQMLPIKKRIEGESTVLGSPLKLRKRIGELGLLGMNTPEKYGGNPQSAVTIGIAIEEIAGYDLPFITTGNSTVNFINLACEEVKEEWLPSIARGDKYINMGATEAEAGSDLRNVKSTARRDGNFWILNGEKNHVSRCFEGDGMVALCKLDPAARHLTPFLVTYDMPGVTRSGIDEIGGCYAGIVSMEDVRIPSKYLLGDEEGKGFYAAMEAFDGMRAAIGLSSIKAAKLCLDETIEYVKKRVVFGQPIAKFEGVSFLLAEAATYVELGRWLSYRVLWMQDRGFRTTMYSSMIKWWGPKIAEWIVHQCLLLHGHYGYSQEMLFGDRLLDLIGDQIRDAPEQIQKMIIARELLGKEYRSYR